MSDLTTTQQDTAPSQIILRGDRRSRAMAQSASFGEEGGPGLMGRAWAIAVTGAVMMGLWAGFIQIDDEVMARGRVIPASDILSIRHLDGGMIGEILVIEGEIVKKGQVLIRLKGDEAKARLRALENEKARTGMLAAGLRALGRGSEPDYSFVPAVYKPLVDQERRIFAGLRELTGKRRQVWAERINLARTKLRNITKQERTLSKKAALLEEELGLRKDLLNKGLTAKKVYLKAKKNVEAAHNDLADLAISKKQTTGDMRRSRRLSGELDIRLKERALDELSILTGRLDALDETLETLKDKIARLDIEAPVGGLIRGVRKQSLGAPVAAGDVVLEILPLTGGVRIETRILPKDFDRVAAGQKVTVRVKAPGFGKFGGIPGTLKEISSSPFEDKNGKPYYRGIVAVSRDSLGSGAAQARMMPGMTAQVSIRTGSKRLFRFFLD